MSLQITKRETMLVHTKQAKVLVRAHRKIHYPRGSKVPLVLDQKSPSPFGIQVIGAIETTLRDISTDSRAKDAGFKNARDFQRHWETALYGAEGIHSKTAADRKGPDAKVVVYRFRRTDVVQKRMRQG